MLDSIKNSFCCCFNNNDTTRNSNNSENASLISRSSSFTTVSLRAVSDAVSIPSVGYGAGASTSASSLQDRTVSVTSINSLNPNLEQDETLLSVTPPKLSSSRPRPGTVLEGLVNFTYKESNQKRAAEAGDRMISSNPYRMLRYQQKPLVSHYFPPSSVESDSTTN